MQILSYNYINTGAIFSQRMLIKCFPCTLQKKNVVVLLKLDNLLKLSLVRVSPRYPLKAAICFIVWHPSMQTSALLDNPLAGENHLGMQLATAVPPHTAHMSICFSITSYN